MAQKGNNTGQITITITITKNRRKKKIYREKKMPEIVMPTNIGTPNKTSTHAIACEGIIKWQSLAVTSPMVCPLSSSNTTWWIPTIR